jgi:hypothetical protein
LNVSRTSADTVEGESPADAGPTDALSAVGHYLFGLTCRMLILFGFYVLSIGPMYWRWYSGKYGNGSAYIAAFYEPLWILCVKFPWLGDWVDSYVWIWNEWGR